VPDFDLDPGGYTERKPKGWRWKLPFDHDDDAKVPFVVAVVFAGAAAYVYLHIQEFTDPGVLYLFGLMIGCVVGMMVQLGLRS